MTILTQVHVILCAILDGNISQVVAKIFNKGILAIVSNFIVTKNHLFQETFWRNQHYMTIAVCLMSH